MDALICDDTESGFLTAAPDAIAAGVDPIFAVAMFAAFIALLVLEFSSSPTIAAVDGMTAATDMPLTDDDSLTGVAMSIGVGEVDGEGMVTDETGAAAAGEGAINIGVSMSDEEELPATAAGGLACTLVIILARAK